MGFNSSSSSSQSSGNTTQWPTNQVPSNYGASSFQSLIDSYISQAQGAYAPYAKLGTEGANKLSALLGLDPYDVMGGYQDRLGGLISRGGDIPQPSFTGSTGSGSSKGGIGSSKGGGQSSARPGSFQELSPSGGGSRKGSGKGGGQAATEVGSESSNYFDIPGRVKGGNFNPQTIEGRDNASTEYERRLVVQNQLTGYLDQAELAIADIGGASTAADRQAAFDQANEFLGTAISAANDFQSDDPYWSKFMSDYGQDLALFQKDFASDFSADMPQQQTVDEILKATPGYQFRFAEGENAANATIAARGLRGSGQQLKALTQYGQDFASNEYNNLINQYMGVTGLGQQATAQEQQLTTGMANTGAQPGLLAASTFIKGPQSMFSKFSSSSKGSSTGVSL